jgi:3-oxoacyl-[acyl-carrier protein] reductase
MTTFLIFGAGSSFGEEMVRKLSVKYEVYTVSRKEMSFDSGNVFHHTVDDYLTQDFSNLIDDLSSKEELEVLFLNGISEGSAFFNVTNQEIENIFKVNVFIPLFLTRDIILSRIGRVTKFVFASSTRALQGDEGITLYSASKSALKGAVASLTKEYARHNQEFYILSLGLFESGLGNTLSEKIRNKLLDRTAHQKFVSSDEVIKSLEFIASSSAGAGSVLNVDHGYLG